MRYSSRRRPPSCCDSAACIISQNTTCHVHPAHTSLKRVRSIGHQTAVVLLRLPPPCVASPIARYADDASTPPHP
jgi:hypothetical protein